MGLFVAEIFESIHGEVNGHHQGRIVTFIRLSGCNLSCDYCDTPHTQDPLYGKNMEILHIVEHVEGLGNDYVCITGGEPLLHKNRVRDLMHILKEKGFRISVETNGTQAIDPFFRYVDSFVLDYKFGEEFNRTNLVSLRETDVIKFVIGNKGEYMTAMHVIYSLPFLVGGCPIVAFSPKFPDMSGKELAELMLEHKIHNSVLSLQIHKVLDVE